MVRFIEIVEKGPLFVHKAQPEKIGMGIPYWSLVWLTHPQY